MRWRSILSVTLLAAVVLAGCRERESAGPAANTATPASAAPADPAALVRAKNLGLAYLEADQPLEAAKQFRGVVAMAPEDPLGHANLAVAELRQQNGRAALEHLARARALAKGDAAAEAAIAELGADAHALAADGDAQVAALIEALRLDPGRLTAAYKLVQYDAGLPPAQVAARDRAALAGILARDPQNLLALLRLARLELDAGTAAQARPRLEALRPPLAGADVEARAQLADALSLTAEGNAADAAVAVTMLENLLRATPAYQAALAILVPPVTGLPLETLRGESAMLAAAAAVPPPAAPPFELRALAQGAAGSGLAVGWRGAGPKDRFWWAGGVGVSGWEGRAARVAVQGETAAVAADFDNDGADELAIATAGSIELWRAGETPARVPGAALASGAGSTRLITADLDHDGDLDLVAALPKPPYLAAWANDGAASLTSLPSAFPAALPGPFRALDVLDWDGDGDLDLAAAGDGGAVLLDNSRLGSFTEIGAVAHAPKDAIAALAIDDRVPAVLWFAGPGVHGTRLGRWRPGSDTEWRDVPEAPGAPIALVLADLANTGLRTPLIAAADRVIEIEPGGAARVLALGDGATLPPLAGVLLEDLDGDGAVDLLARGAEGSVLGIRNTRAPGNYLAVRLAGLTQGSGKVNAAGIGSTVEVKAGTHAARQLARGRVTHFGLGAARQVDVLRVVWTNGVPQSHLRPGANALLTETQMLKGSCPFLYAWDGKRMRFVTDLLWGAPAGLPFAPGVWAGADVDEHILFPGDALVPRDGRLNISITEELWEAAFFDRAALYAVDHPAATTVATNTLIAPPPYEHGLRLHSFAHLRAVRARTAEGDDLTAEVARIDERYSEDFTPGPYQGYAAPHAMTLDLGAVAHPERLKLVLSGWIFPTDASINLALAARRDLPPPMPPRLEAEQADGTWRTLTGFMGFPGGKTKTVVVDLGSYRLRSPVRLRLTTTMWLRWDAIAWTDEAEPAPAEAPRVTRLEAVRAVLGERGVSAMLPRQPRAPHRFDYDRVVPSPWRDMPGRYTRLGDVRELLAAADDRSVVMKPGDEIRVSFDAGALPPLPAGWRRDWVLESHGWDKDFDIHTAYGQSLEPLPFRAMTRYPYTAGERYPGDAVHRLYLREWNTRVVEGGTPRAGRWAGIEQIATPAGAPAR